MIRGVAFVGNTGSGVLTSGVMVECVRAGVGDPAEPTGILTHHLDLDAPAWAFLAELFARTREHGAATWLDVDAVFGTTLRRSA